MIKLKWGLPGDFMGGIMIFGIMFTIAIIELYALKAWQASSTGPKGMQLVIGGGGTPSMSDIVTNLKPCNELKTKKAREECLEAKQQGRGGKPCTSSSGCPERVVSQ